MHMLKSLVVGMGILIVVGMAVLAYAVYFRSTNPDFSLFKDAHKSGPATAGIERPKETPQPFGNINIKLPQGCHIVEMRPGERGRRLSLRIGPPGRCERVIVLDIRSGIVLGTIGVKETP